MLTHLLLMRHAKSSWDDPVLGDHQRPLNERGETAADAVGATLTARGYAPELIWTSDATRTYQTAQRLIRAIPGPQVIIKVPDFYHADPETVLAHAKKEGEPDGVSRLMWLGHNPGWADLFGYYTGQHMDVPTGACLVLSRKGDGDWLKPTSWSVRDLILPRDLG